jgi:hypothetical protein
MFIIDSIIIHVQVALITMIESGKVVSLSEERRRLQSIYIQLGNPNTRPYEPGQGSA